MAWLTNWTYRKEITVSNASANYPTKILVAVDAVDGEDVDCENHVAADFDDLRFTAADGETLLDYWIEVISGTIATVWVENNATPDTTLYMYYGGTETAVSSGANTFTIFDDFERGNNGDTVGGDWTEEQAHCHISTAQAYDGTRSLMLVGAATAPYCYIAHTAADNSYAIRYRLYKEDATTLVQLLHGDGSNLINQFEINTEDVEYYDTDYRDTGTNITADDWELIELTNITFTGTSYDIWVNDVKAQDDAGMQSSAIYEDKIRFSGAGAVGQDSWIDNFIVRKWATTEPSFAFGSETTEGWANIAKVCGVTATDLAKVDGIAVADIAKINGVAV